MSEMKWPPNFGGWGLLSISCCLTKGTRRSFSQPPKSETSAADRSHGEVASTSGVSLDSSGARVRLSLRSRVGPKPSTTGLSDLPNDRVEPSLTSVAPRQLHAVREVENTELRISKHRILSSHHKKRNSETTSVLF